MGNMHRFLPGDDLEIMNNPVVGIEAACIMAGDDIAAIRNLLPRGIGAGPEQQAAMAWEQEDDHAAAFAYGVADRIRQLRQG